MNIEAIIFDVDGVLIDSEPMHLEAANGVLAGFGHHLSEEENKPYLGLDDLAFWILMKERFDLKDDVEALVSKKVDTYLALLEEGASPMPGVPELVTGAAMRGLKVGAASSSPKAVVSAILKELGLSNTIKVISCGDEVEKGKPDPAVYLKTAKALDVAPKNCLAIEDSPNGVLAARRANMYTVAVENRYSQAKDLQQADKIISGLERFDWSIFETR